MAANHGPFIWYQYATNDKQKAAEFYGHVMPWTVTDSGMPDIDYTVLNAPDTGIGGLVNTGNGEQPGWLGYIAVANVDETVAAYEANGGRVVAPAMDIPEVGRIAVVADPDGANLAVMTPRSDATWSPDSMRLPGHCGWHELYARDGQRAFDFYTKVFGWTKSVGMDMGPMGIYQLFAQDGQDIGGMMTMTPQTPSPLWNFYFQVDSVDAGAARATEKGGMLMNGPMQVPGGGWVVQFIDPEGAMFAMLSAER